MNPEQPGIENKRILIIDDEKGFAHTLADRLLLRQISADIVNDGEKAIQRLQTTCYSAILLDLQMPGIGGLETLKRIRDDNPRARVIILTATDDIKVTMTAMKFGAFDYITKPFQIDELEKSIQAALEN